MWFSLVKSLRQTWTATLQGESLVRSVGRRAVGSTDGSLLLYKRGGGSLLFFCFEGRARVFHGEPDDHGVVPANSE